MRVAGAQMPNVVGDLSGNAERIAAAMRWAEGEGADVLVLPELALTGYPLADLALHREFVADAREHLERLAAGSGRTVVVVGTVERVPPQRTWDARLRDVAISSALLSGGEIRGIYHKVLLPTHSGYDEGRTFAAGRRPDAVWRLGDVVAGVCICEDLWSDDGPPEAQSLAGAQIILAPNASPYWRGKPQGRLRLARSVARRNGLALVYVNLVGGQDETVFDGGSLVVDADGELLHRSPEFVEDRFLLDVPVAAPRPLGRHVTTVHTRPLSELDAVRPALVAPASDEVAGVWQALVAGTRDFAARNGFDAAVLGLSGGIDAAVTAAVAAEALPAPDRVLGVGMPAPGSPPDDLVDAEKVAANLGIEFQVIDIGPVTAALGQGLRSRLGRRPAGDTRAGLEARARAAILLGIGEELGRLVLATGNKSELSIGAGALHGDVAGGFAPLRDCPKTLLYDLARHRNQAGMVIPEQILAKRTSAQRQPGDWPPPYEELDPIVERYIEHGDGLEDLIAAGFDPETAVRVLRAVDAAEFDRRLVPPGVKITAQAFGHDRRMPMSNLWRAHRRARGGPTGR